MKLRQLEKHRNSDGYIDLSCLEGSVETYVGDKGSRDKKWYELEDGKILFKTRARYGAAIDNFEHFGEIIAQDFCAQVGIPCAEYELATLNGEKGVISLDYRRGRAVTTGKTVLESARESIKDTPNAHDFQNNLIDIEEALRLTLQGSRQDYRKIMHKLVCLYVFDVFTDQSDRHESNWETVYEDRKKEHDLAEAFDNGSIYRMHTKKSKVIACYESLKNNPEKYDVLFHDKKTQRGDRRRMKLRYRDSELTQMEDFREFCMIHYNNNALIQYIAGILQIDEEKTISKIQKAYKEPGLEELCGWLRIATYNKRNKMLRILYEMREKQRGAKSLFKLEGTQHRLSHF